MSKMDPEAAAEFAVGEGGDPSGVEAPDAGGSEGPFDRLFDGDAPGPTVGELQMDYEMPQWMAVAARGILRVATGSGVPPIFEILMGTVMGVMQNTDAELPDRGDGEDGSSAQLGDGDMEVA